MPDGSIHRNVLPIPSRRPVGLTRFDAKDPDATFAPIEPLSPPPGAPNVLIVRLDDVGFGSSSAAGGPVNMRTAERLAGSGLNFNRFHTTLCAPTRAALLTGRNITRSGWARCPTSRPRRLIGVRALLRAHRRRDQPVLPPLYSGTTPIERPRTPEEGYRLTEDLANRAIAWVRHQKALMPDKPFFMYFAPGAAHAPVCDAVPRWR